MPEWGRKARKSARNLRSKTHFTATSPNVPSPHAFQTSRNSRMSSSVIHREPFAILHLNREYNLKLYYHDARWDYLMAWV
jgi:hypothetical protein